jgi:hypothetical protein
MRRLDNKGNAAIILCVAITVLFGFTAYVIDIGLVYAEKIKLSNAIDAAALAAVLELPASSVKAKAVAEEYIVRNEINVNEALITVSSDNRSIEIRGSRNVEHLFAPIIGINSSSVSVGTKAVIGPAKSVKGGIRPFAVEKFDYSYGTLVTLKEGAGDGYHGNYGVIALGRRGESVFKANALDGYSGTISVGDWIDTETGNMSGATNTISNYINSEYSTFSNYSRDSIRIWTIPLVNTLLVNGRGQIQVVGFAEFYVEDVVKRSGKTEINGRFIRYVTNSEIDMYLEDTGVYGGKLSR